MGFFNKFLKGLGFEEEESTAKPQKQKEKRKKEEKKNWASYDLKNIEKEEKQIEKINIAKEDTIDKEEIKESQTSNKTQFEIVNVSSQVEVQSVVNRLKNGEKILINMSALGNEDKVRSLDFLSGAVFALNMTMQKVDGSVFIIQ